MSEEYLEARVRRVELKQADTEAKVLAELRDMRAWLSDHMKAHREDLQRIIKHLMANGVE